MWRADCPPFVLERLRRMGRCSGLVTDSTEEQETFGLAPVPSSHVPRDFAARLSCCNFGLLLRSNGMRDLKHRTLIFIKGFLFLVLGVISAGLLLLDRPSAKTGFLLTVAVWSFCRFYYFAFYVVERYLDSSYRFRGLISLVLYLARKSAGTAKA